jgi:hypothetical protein
MRLPPPAGEACRVKGRISRSRKQMSPVSLSSGDLLLDRRYRWALDYRARE